LTGAGNGVAFSPDGSYIAAAHSTNPGFTLLNHTTPGTISLAATYTIAGGSPSGSSLSTAFSPDGNYIAVAHFFLPYFTLLNHTTPGTISLAATYTCSSTANGVAFSSSGSYIALAQNLTGVGLLNF
jgi:WD40 repeat protein